MNNKHNNKPNTSISLKQKLLEFTTDSRKILKSSLRLIKYVFFTSKGFFVVFFLTLVLMSLETFVFSWVNSKIIDNLVRIVAQQDVDVTILFYFLGVAVGLRIASSFMSRINRYASQNLWFKIGRRVEMDLVTSMAYLDIQTYENPEIRDKLNKATSSSSAFQNQTELVFDIIDAIIQILSATLILIYFYPLLILLLLITSLPEIIVDIVYGKKSWGIWNLKGDQKRDYYRTKSFLTDNVPLAEVRTLGARKFLLDRIFTLYNNFEQERLRIENRRTISATITAVVSILGLSAAYIFTILKVLVFEITIGQFTFYSDTLGRLNRGLGKLLKAFSRGYETGLYVNDIFEVIDIRPQIVSGGLLLSKTKEPPTIEFINISFKYPGTNKAILENFNLKISPHEHIAFVGENGAGKSTIINLLMRFYDADEGTILIDGKDIRELDLDSWYSKVGVLFQRFNHYHFDSKLNITIGNVNNPINMQKMLEASKKSEAHEFIKNYELGYDQILNRGFKNGIEPSVGQWQKIALARAFYKDAPILILDEPTSAIDPKAEFEIFENLFDFAKEKSVIIISHRFSTVRNATRILVLKDGKIIEDGSHETLMANKDGVYKNAFEIQKRGYE